MSELIYGVVRANLTESTKDYLLHKIASLNKSGATEFVEVEVGLEGGHRVIAIQLGAGIPLVITD